MEKIINLALDLAHQAATTQEIPVAAVIFNTQSKEILCAEHNLVVTDNDPTAHAEILALRKAGRLLGNYNLSGYSIFVTLEPCAMCACALSWAKIDRVYFGAYDVKSGAIENGPHIFNCATTHHKPEVFGGFNEAECQKILTDFFERIREK